MTAAFFDRLDRFGAYGCWEWTGLRSPQGYGRVKVNGRDWLAHRYSYEQKVGPIPEGYEIDHLCFNRACVNPAHLEAVIPAVNIERRPCGVHPLALRTHCENGHPYDEVNTRYRRGNGRACRTCQRANSARYKARKQLTR